MVYAITDPSSIDPDPDRPSAYGGFPKRSSNHAGVTGTLSIETSKEVLKASLDYSRIRSIVSPLAVMGLTSQAVLLCSQDTKTPALAVLVASIVNVIGDYIFVAKMNWGISGAALATSMASV